MILLIWPLLIVPLLLTLSVSIIFWFVEAFSRVIRG